MAVTWLAVGLGFGLLGRGENPEPAGAGAVRAAAAAEAEQAYTTARTEFQSDPVDASLAWRFARACFDWAEFAVDKEQRAAIAEEGIAAGRAAVRGDPDLAAAHYYLAMNLGQLARTKLLGALSLVKDMEALFLEARRLDPDFDYAGPDRCLGLLYRDAPGWPVSLGSRKKARRHLEQAAARAPEYFSNRLNLFETFVQWGDQAEALRQHALLKELFPTARQRFSGEKWALSWVEWEARWEQLVAQLEGKRAADP